MRMIVALCEVRYSGRLNARLPEAVRLVMIKADGSVLIHADSGGYKPLNWMSAPAVVEESDGRLIVRKLRGDESLEIDLREVLSDSSHSLDVATGLDKTGSGLIFPVHVFPPRRSAAALDVSDDAAGSLCLLRCQRP